MFGVGFGLVAGVAKHQALVAGALVVNGLNHASVDVCGLARDELSDLASLLRRGVHADGVVHVADVRCGLAGDGDVIGSLDSLGELDLTGQHDVRSVLTSFDEGFHGHLGFGVESEARINDGVGDGVAQLVGMAGRNRFGGEQPRLRHVLASSLFYSILAVRTSNNATATGSRGSLWSTPDHRRTSHVPTV